MISAAENTKLSKFLSLVLRHQPEVTGIALDEAGWAAVPELLAGLRAKGFAIDFKVLQHVVDTNAKKRFAFNKDKSKIRASQGHSVEVNLQYEATEPPPVLYHGSAAQNREAILREGLQKRARHHVHLSALLETARQVGQRHGRPVVFKVAADEMHRAGYVFYISQNGVWLTDAVPPQYLTLMEG